MCLIYPLHDKQVHNVNYIAVESVVGIETDPLTNIRQVVASHSGNKVPCAQIFKVEWLEASVCGHLRPDTSEKLHIQGVKREKFLNLLDYEQ